MSSAKEKSNAFLSLKWKMMSLLGLVLVVLTALLITWSYINQISRFEKEREAVNSHYLEQVGIMFKDFSLKISQVSSLVATTASLSDGAFSSGNVLSRQDIESRINVTWAALQVDYGLESMRIYDRNSHVIAQWGSTLPLGNLGDGQVAEAMQHESSVTWVDCMSICQQYAATPMLTQGQVSGAVVVSATMADLILAFHRISGADIGFILNNHTGGNQGKLPRLGMRVAGLSNADINLPLLQELESIPVAKNNIHWQRLEAKNKYHELVFQPIDDRLGHMQALIVVIDDITAAMQGFHNLALQKLEIGLVTSFLLMLFIYFLLNLPLKRVTKAVQAIPLIGQHEFDEARAHIHIRKTPMFSDEVDQLGEAALQLVDRLQLLENDASMHQAEIMDMLHRISLANEFSERILNTAQVVIITQDIDGTVNSINHYGEELLGWSRDSLRGKSLVDALKIGEGKEQLLQIYKIIASGEVERHYHECTTICKNGAEREIAWHHSRMDGDAVQILSVGVDITLRKRSEERSIYLAEHDQLTGLMNRQRFMIEAEALLKKINHSKERYALLYLDLDGFKYINDISGHQAGDIVLRMVADELSKICGDKDVLARLGGDEMGILLHDCSMDKAVKVAEKINHRLTEIKYPGLVGEHQVSASIGIVSVTADDRDVRHLLANADIAMYQAKYLGRARWYVFSEGEGLQEKLEERVLWEDRIKQAIRDERFVLHYQPIQDIHQNIISHYEALVRMVGEDGSLIPPVEFIEVAEKAGLIRELDHYVVRTVIKRWAALLAEGKRRKVAINLSGLSMSDTTLLEMLQDLFQQHPELPSQVIFEITETAAVADFTSAQEFIETVRAMGCAFSLDDFGVGFSSFYYVKHLKVDYVKIDGSFIRNLADSPDDQIFVRALTEVARGFGKLTVAEFVGDERSLSLLRSYGVNYAQGYYIGKPGTEIL